MSIARVPRVVPLLLLAAAAACARREKAAPPAVPAPGAIPAPTPADPGVTFARRIPDARGVAYAAEVAPGVYRGGAPDAEGVLWLKQMGVRTVVNLRHYHGESEGERVRAAGMRYERIKLESSDAPEPVEINRFLDLVSDPALRPVYVHCLHGVDRTGTMMALYRMEIDRWTTEQAIAEMDHFGPHAMWHDLKRFVREYRPTRRAAAPSAPPAPSPGQ